MMSIHTTKADCSKTIRPLAMAILLASLLNACGRIETLEIDVPDEGLNLVENAAPAEEYAFYVSSDSVPQSAQDLRRYGVVGCTGDEVANRAMQIGMGLGISRISYGEANAECLNRATERHALMVTQRTNRPPRGVVEIVFR